jgi:hypothetical protein
MSLTLQHLQGKTGRGRTTTGPTKEALAKIAEAITTKGFYFHPEVFSSGKSKGYGVAASRGNKLRNRVAVAAGWPTDDKETAETLSSFVVGVTKDFDPKSPKDDETREAKDKDAIGHVFYLAPNGNAKDGDVTQLA